MADLENQAVGVSVQHDQGALPEAQHGPTDAGETTRGPARLLVVLGDVHNVEQRDLALARVVAGLSSWDSEAGGCDVDEQLNAFVKLQPKGITDPTGETVVEHKSEFLDVQVLVNPRFQTLQKKLLSFITNESSSSSASSSSSYRFLLYSGLTLQNSGCWFLQDGCFSFSSLVELFHQSKVELEAGKQNDSILDLSVVAETGDWTKAGIAKLESQLKIRLNPPPKVERKTDGSASFSNFISPFLKTPSCDDLLPSTKAVGNFGQSTATMHVFPAGQGDSALFGVSGFNLLLDGGYARRSCFWEMVRHLSTLDAIIVSRLGPDNLFGIGSFLEKKIQAKEHPELGVVYLNETKNSTAASDSKPSLLINLVDKSLSIVDSLRHLGTPVLPCLGSVHGQVLHPTNLYHKVGHGSVDLYVLSPLNEAKETKMIGGQKADNLSSSFLVVWRPASPNEKLTRILFPGNTPQAKIFDGLDRLKLAALFQNALGVAEKIQGTGKGVEKSAAASAKPATAKAKPPSALRPETKDAKKALPEQKTSADQHKQIAQKAGESKEIKKVGSDVKKAIAVSSDAKNGKAVGVVKKEKDLPVKATPGPSRIARKTDGDGGKGGKKATSAKQPPAALATGAAAATTGAGEVVKDEAPELVEADTTAAMPAPSEVDAPLLDISPEMVGAGELSQVQALPDPTAPEEHLAEEAAMQTNKEELEEEEAAVEDQPDQPEKLEDDSLAENDGDSAEVTARGDGQNVAAADKSFDPSKEWGMPDGLPAPVNGKEPAAATAKKASQSVSIVGPAANAKKPDNTARNTETKMTGGKRPTTAPERLNNTTREEEDKGATAGAMAKGRLSITSSHKDGTSSARGDLKKPKPVVPFYVDVAYIPGHGSLHYFDVDFFRRVRARNYVLSSIDPNVKALALLVEAKQTWEDSSAEVSIIPTYDSESMLAWIHDNKDQLQKLNIKIGPPAYKCRMQLQELDTSCASYRLEL